MIGLNEILFGALVLVIALLLVRLLTRRLREDAKFLMGTGRGTSRAYAVSPEDDTLVGEVRSMLAEGDRLEAIQHIRRKTGLSLDAARKRVEEIERETAAAPAELTITQLIRLARELTPEARRLIKAGRKTEAAALLRRKTGMDEKTARKIVDRIG